MLDIAAGQRLRNSGRDRQVLFEGAGISSAGATPQSAVLEQAPDGKSSLAGGTVTFAKALNRSVTGSMNDLIKHATYWLTEDEVSPHELGFRLNDIPMSALDRSKSDFYWKPREAFKQLADRQAESMGE